MHTHVSWHSAAHQTIPILLWYKNKDIWIQIWNILHIAFSLPINLLVVNQVVLGLVKQNIWRSCPLCLRIGSIQWFLFKRSSSAAPAEAAAFYQPLYCLSLLPSIRPHKVAVTSVSDGDMTFSCMSHSSWNWNTARIYIWKGKGIILCVATACKVVRSRGAINVCRSKQDGGWRTRWTGSIIRRSYSHLCLISSLKNTSFGQVWAGFTAQSVTH